MKDSITIKHSLPYSRSQKKPVLVVTINNKQMFITEGISTKATATICPVCGHVLHCNGTNVRSIRDIDLLGHYSMIRIKLKRMRCPSCNYSSMQDPGFEAEHHKITQSRWFLPVSIFLIRGTREKRNSAYSGAFEFRASIVGYVYFCMYFCLYYYYYICAPLKFLF